MVNPSEGYRALKYQTVLNLAGRLVTAMTMQWLKAFSLYSNGKESDDEYTGIAPVSRELGAIHQVLRPICVHFDRFLHTFWE
ncbi:MAG: hypothetical protein ACI809_002428 [Candidatus Azotimanducaceae bacterium]|jgi:hypothetical protein